MKTKEIQRIPSETILMKYLGRTVKVDREDLKMEIQSLCGQLAERNIFVTIDFQPSGERLYSDTLDRDIWFCQSAGLIIQREGSIIYEITERGYEKINNKNSAIYENANLNALATLDELLTKVPQRYDPKSIPSKVETK